MVTTTELARRLCEDAHPFLRSTGAVVPCAQHIQDATRLGMLTEEAGTTTLAVLLKARDDNGATMPHPFLRSGAIDREDLRRAIGTDEAGNGLPHWHHASGGTSDSVAQNDRDGVFVDRQHVLDVIDGFALAPGVVPHG